MPADFNIRLIDVADAAATLEIYRPYVEQTIISFEYEVPLLSEWQDRINTISADYPWLVCEYQNQIIGYTYGCKHRYRTAYNWSAEVAIYIAESFHGKGLARIMYQTLFDLLKLQGYVNVYAGIGMPNVKSEKLHTGLGFEEIGTFKNIGYKHGAWHDTRWFQYHLIPSPSSPEKPVSIAEIHEEISFVNVISDANSRLRNFIPGA